MKILFQYIYGSGGALANLVTLLKTFAEQYPDDKIVVMCAPHSKLEKLAEKSNVVVSHYGGGGNRILNRLKLGWNGMERAVTEHRPDVVWSVNTGAFGSLACPQVLQLNNAYQVYPLAYARFHPRGRIAVGILSWLFRLSARNSEIVVCQTESVARLARAAIGDSRRLEVIGKAVSTGPSVVAPSASDAQTTSIFSFGYVAAAYSHKNHRILLRAFDALQSKSPHYRLHLTLSEEEVRTLGGRRADLLLRRGAIVAHGWVPPADLPAFYSAVDACVMPSLLESLSSAHVEAMAMGKPQVLADLPYARELCGESALYADPSDFLAWRDAMKHLAEDPDLATALGQEGARRFALLPQSWSEIAERWRELLASVCSTEVLK